MLTVLDAIPPGLLDADATDLHRLLAGPTLIHLAGRRQRPLFISLLLHGNETTGLVALQGLLIGLQGQELPRSLSIFIGNVQAARYGLRRLDGQTDFNRIWRGGPDPEHDIARQVLEQMQAREVFACIDVHNNTGLNPHYACVNRLDAEFLQLARLFSRTVVYFIRPNTVLSMAFAALCPAVTVECGQPGQPHGTEHVREFLNAALHLSELPDQPPGSADLDLFHTVATVTIPETVSFGFANQQDQQRDPQTTVDLCLAAGLDHLNFRELPPGTRIATVLQAEHARIQAWDEHGREQTSRFFETHDGELRTTRAVMPSMFTLDERVIRQDCLGYLMERYPVPSVKSSAT